MFTAIDESEPKGREVKMVKFLLTEYYYLLTFSLIDQCPPPGGASLTKSANCLFPNCHPLSVGILLVSKLPLVKRLLSIGGSIREELQFIGS